MLPGVRPIDARPDRAGPHGTARQRAPLRGVATYGDVYRLTYLRGPSGILVMLAQELKKT